MGKGQGRKESKKKKKIFHRTRNITGPLKTADRWSINPTLGHIPRQKYNSKRYMHLYVYDSTVYNSRDLETA